MGYRAYIASTLLALLMVSGCTTNPVTGASQFSLISPEQEVSIGAKQFGPTQQTQGGQYMVDPDLTVYVNQVGQKLAAKSDRPNLPYDFVVLNNDVPNAWALPGGKIAINRGLLVQLEDEAQLAAVLAHEIVHAAARHSAQQMTQGMLLGVGGQIIGMAGSQTAYGELIGMGTQMGSALIQARYGRDQELESDYYGMTYMARAGYEPEAAVELQQTFVKLSEGHQGSWMDGLLASHPPSIERVQANKAHAAKLTPGVRNKQAYQNAIRQAKKDQAAYDQHQKALKAASDKNLDQAIALTKKSISAQPKEPLFYTTLGQLQLEQKDYKSALNSFTQAHKLYPEYFLPLLGSGLSAKALKAYTRAEQDLISSAKLLPTQSAVFYLGEVKLAQGQKDQAIAYFQQAAQGRGALAEKSKAYLQELAPAAQPPAQ
ncbi:M48 family metalloprotease [Aestuariicella hydrocarbonica]|uniref:M48 family metalloprotease n=2 Tax=Pseudomaricurvus hydrocarbonicus TaxID=1470433 RepID=A0A9E5MQ00_9GAMM|nr:M48 family metalloprotease [Aestuariicella hydrocarbonica]